MVDNVPKIPESVASVAIHVYPIKPNRFGFVDHLPAFFW
jgi:hypothetical protein